VVALAVGKLDGEAVFSIKKNLFDGPFDVGSMAGKIEVSLVFGR